MINHVRTTPEPPGQAGACAPNRDRIIRRLFELDPTLEVGTPRYSAAFLLLSGDACRQNTHRLSRFTGLDLTFVARCARRLVDAGIWAAGETRSGWDDPERGAVAFRADVDVALGLAHRRVDAAGRVAWERAGGPDRLRGTSGVPPSGRRDLYSRRGGGAAAEDASDVLRPRPATSRTRTVDTDGAEAGLPRPSRTWLGVPGDRRTTVIGDGGPERFAAARRLADDGPVQAGDQIAASAFPEAIWL